MSIGNYINTEAIKKYFNDVEVGDWRHTLKVCDFIKHIPEKDFKRTLCKELMHMINNKEIELSDEKYTHLIFVLLDDICDNDSYEVLRTSYFGLKESWYHPYIMSSMCSYVMNLCYNSADMVYLYSGNLRMSEEDASDFFEKNSPIDIDNIRSQGYSIFTGISKDTLIRNAFEFVPKDEIDIFYETFKEHFNNEYHVFGIILE